jgi:hypothetical protein
LPPIVTFGRALLVMTAASERVHHVNVL